MYKDDCVGRVCKLPFLSDFVRITGQEWHKNPEGKIYTELKGRRVFLDDETSPENRNPSAAPSKEGACVGIELPLLKPDGTMLENTFAIVPAQYRKWFKNMGPWYFDDTNRSIYALISEDPTDRVYLRDVVWTLLATESHAEIS